MVGPIPSCERIQDLPYQPLNVNIRLEDVPPAAEFVFLNQLRCVVLRRINASRTGCKLHRSFELSIDGCWK